ncbi:RNA polymerase sigma-70 factor [Geofilum sp. OHC36d9]|uniref:RNA polymerase sigma-70 factor n=1 Tax=Geofilum sp. OHC36d9 TaxID=3458413 RepID=UPI004033D8B6
MKYDSDSILAQKVAAGDERAFESLFRKFYAAMVGLALRFLHDKDAAENIAQAVFVNWWEKRSQLNINTPASYLMMAVRNSCLNELQQKKRFVRDAGMIDIVSTDEPDTDHNMIEKVQKVIGMMPSRPQEIFRLNRFENLRYKDIAKQKGVSVKTIEAYMSQALKFLRENLPLYVMADN